MRLLFILVVTFCTIVSFKSDEETENIYKQSLQLYLGNTKTDTVYILKCFDIKLPSKIGRYNIIDIENSDRNLLKEKGSLYAIKVMPIVLKKDTIVITLIEYLVSEENNERLIKNSGSQVFRFKYNAVSRRYKLISRTKNSI